jgi:hypothetical protein
MVSVTLIGLLIVAAFVTLPELRPKLRTCLGTCLLVLFTMLQCFVWKLEDGKCRLLGRTVNEDARIKTVLILILFLVVASLTREPQKKAETRLISLSFWIPRKHREGIAGDILEDCHEMRELGFTEWRILGHVLWQFTLAVISLWPEAAGSAVAAIVKRVWKTKQ